MYVSSRLGEMGKMLFAQSGKLLRNISKVSGAKFHVGVKASLNLGNYKDQIVGFRQKPDLAPIAPVIRVAGQARAADKPPDSGR